jgi:GNAT superfamily N-acetyltransferase
MGYPTTVTTSAAELYVANAREMWADLGRPYEELTCRDEIAVVRVHGGVRYLVCRPLPAARLTELMDVPVAGSRTVVEDPFGVSEAVMPAGVTTLRMPVMVRPWAAVEPRLPRGVSAGPVLCVSELERAEQVIVDGFPQPHLRPWTPGAALAPRVLDLRGWRVWLARQHGVPAAAGYTYDDGRAVGIYWLTTLPDHRGTGLGQALMTVMLAAHPRRVATLVATPVARRLYERLGFGAASSAAWYLRQNVSPPRD